MRNHTYPKLSPLQDFAQAEYRRVELAASNRRICILLQSMLDQHGKAMTKQQKTDMEDAIDFFQSMQ